ncbi:hypothetical protein IW262DRAFT_1301961 [Armillaria fumosa]|nr:hypothetical protein IW262DRAFT_1301961 [Armillaria fumosa]
MPHYGMVSLSVVLGTNILSSSSSGPTLLYSLASTSFSQSGYKSERGNSHLLGIVPKVCSGDTGEQSVNILLTETQTPDQPLKPRVERAGAVVEWISEDHEMRKVLSQQPSKQKAIAYKDLYAYRTEPSKHKKYRISNNVPDKFDERSGQLGVRWP